MKLRLATLAAVAFIQCANIAPAIAGEPSFDCAKASSDVEQTICASVELSERDRQLANAYRALRDTLSAGRRAALVRDQRAWLEKRDSCCGIFHWPEIPIQDTINLLLYEYSVRLRELDAIGSRPEVFTDRGWDLDRPIIHGDAFEQLSGDTKAFIYQAIKSAFHPEHLADNLATLTLKDSHSGELLLSFDVRPVCHELSEFVVAAQRTSLGKRYELWSGVFYKNERFIDGADFDSGAVQKCSQDGARIVVEIDADYDPRSAEHVVTNTSRYVIDTTARKASVEKVAAARFVKEELVGTFFDGCRYHRIEAIDGSPKVVEVTDLHGTPLKLWPESQWDDAKATLTWSFRHELPIYYGGATWIGFDFIVSTKVESRPIAEVTSDSRGYLPHFEKIPLQRVDAPLYRPLDYYYSKPSIDRLALRSDFYDEHELEPDSRDSSRQAVCRKIDNKFVGFLQQREFVPTNDIGPIPAGYDPATCRLCMGSEDSRRQTCGFGRFTM
jgi:uncharacterized protein YecT (DUF1311 family)